MEFFANLSLEQLVGQVSYALVWTLLHSLWQIALTAILLRGILLFGRNFSAQARYMLGVIALVVVICLSLYNFVHYLHLYQKAALLLSASNRLLLPLMAGEVNSLDLMVNQYVDVLALCWSIGFLFAVCRYCGALIYCRQLVSAGVEALPGIWQDVADRAQYNIGVKRRVRTRLSTRAIAPCVIGHFAPVLLLPAALVQQMDVKQLEMVLLHEFAHIRRHDYLVGLVLRFVQTIFFFNPFTGLITRVIEREREYICDDMAVACCGDAHLYSRSLQLISELSYGAGMAMSIHGNQSDMLTRVKRQFNDEALAHQKPYVGILAILALMVGFMFSTANAVGSVLHTSRFEGIESLSQEQIATLVTQARGSFAIGRKLRNHFFDDNPLFQQLTPAEKERLYDYVQTELWYLLDVPSWKLGVYPGMDAGAEQALRKLHLEIFFKTEIWPLFVGKKTASETLTEADGMTIITADFYDNSRYVELSMATSQLQLLLSSPARVVSDDKIAVKYSAKSGLTIAVTWPRSPYAASELLTSEIVPQHSSRVFEHLDSENRVEGLEFLWKSFDRAEVIVLPPVIVDRVRTGEFVSFGDGALGAELTDGVLKIYIDNGHGSELRQALSDYYLQYGKSVKPESLNREENLITALTAQQKSWLYTDAELDDFLLKMELEKGFKLSESFRGSIADSLQKNLIDKISGGEYTAQSWQQQRPLYSRSQQNIFIAFRHYFPSSSPGSDFDLNYRQVSFATLAEDVQLRCSAMTWLKPVEKNSETLSVKYLNLNCDRATPVMCRIVTQMYPSQEFVPCAESAAHGQ